MNNITPIPQHPEGQTLGSSQPDVVEVPIESNLSHAQVEQTSSYDAERPSNTEANISNLTSVAPEPSSDTLNGVRQPIATVPNKLADDFKMKMDPNIIAKVRQDSPAERVSSLVEGINLTTPVSAEPEETITKDSG